MKRYSTEEAERRIDSYLSKGDHRPFFVAIDNREVYQQLLEHYAALTRLNLSEFGTGGAFPDTDEFIDACNRLQKDALCLDLDKYCVRRGDFLLLDKLTSRSFPHRLLILCRGVYAWFLQKYEDDRKFFTRQICCIDAPADISEFGSSVNRSEATDIPAADASTSVELVTQTVTVGGEVKPILKFRVSRQLQNARVEIDGNSFNATAEDSEIYAAELGGVKSGRHSAKIFDGDDFLGELNFTAEHIGFKENDDGGFFD